MARKKTTTAQLPPTFARVVVAEALASEAARSRFLAAVQLLADSGVVDRVMRLVRIERGVWRREGHRWPAAIRRLAVLAFRSAGLLEDMATLHGLACDQRAPAEARLGLERELLRVLQLMMDELYESDRDPDGRIGDAMAGLGGVAGELAAFGVASGVEAAWHLVAGVGRTLRGKVDEPFWPYVASAAAQRRMRKQVGRERPASVRDLEHDDLKILRACQEGALPAKVVATTTGLSASHVSKRTADLRAWGLLTNARAFEVSSTGRAWLRAASQG